MSLSAPLPYGMCWSSRTRIPAIPAGLASTMILVSLYGEKYGIAVTGENATLALLNASVCGCSHFQVATLRMSLRRGSVMVVQFRMKRALYWRYRERTQLSRISRLSHVFKFLRGGGETISREYVNEELDAWLVELTFRRIVGHGEAGLVKSAERLVE